MKFTGKKTRQLIRIGLLHKYLTPFDLYLFSVQQYLHSPAYGILRKTARLIEWMDGILDKTPYYKQEIDGLVFYWNTKEEADSYTGFRIDSKREAVDLPPREVANAARNILEQQVALPLVDLMRVTAQLLGYARFGLNVETAMRRGVQILRT